MNAMPCSACAFIASFYSLISKKIMFYLVLHYAMMFDFILGHAPQSKAHFKLGVRAYNGKFEHFLTHCLAPSYQ
jgi:hypothetical protein